MSSPMSETAVSLPAPPLRPYITQYAGFRASGLPPGMHFGLPSTEVDLIISLHHPIELLQMPNPTQAPSSFRALVTGLQQAPAVVRLDGEPFGLHVFITPLGVRAILGVPSAEIASLVVNLSDIWGCRAGDLVDMLLGAETWRQRFAVLDRVFLSSLSPTPQSPAVEWAWRRLASSHGAVSVAALAREIGCSRRHLSECFRDSVGVSPKSAARVFRFERACRMIADTRGSLARVAVACGYYDQAHLTREWHALAGCSPKAWIARELPFLQDYELGGRDNPSHGSEPLHQSVV